MKTSLIGTVAAGLLFVAAPALSQDYQLPPIDVAPSEAPVESQTLPPLEFEPDAAPGVDPVPDGFYSDPDAPPAETETPQQDLPPVESDPSVAPPVEGVPAPAAKIERLKNKVAEFSGIDKITGRITSFDVYVDETVQFGALQVTPRVCYTSPPSAPPKTDSFVEVNEITLDREIKRIFTGWMFADSPGLNAVEHPIYDVWLKGCKSDSAVPAPAG